MSEEEKLLTDAKKSSWEERLLHKNQRLFTDSKDPRIRELGLPMKLLMQLWQNALWCSCFRWSWRLGTYSCLDVTEECGEVSQSMSRPVLTRENYAPKKPQMERHPLALLNIMGSNKDERQRTVVCKFTFEESQLEQKQIHDLENEIMKYFREDLYSQLLSTDFNKQVDGIKMLQKALPSIAKEIIEVLDILLKWFVLRFFRSNTSCLLQVLEFLPELFDTLRNENYTINEAEASIFPPCLVEKTGHANKELREKIRELMKTKIECTHLVGFMLDNYYSEIYPQLKSLQIVTRLFTAQSGVLRKAAINCLATGYKILGDEIWIYVGKVNEEQRSILDEKFKWKIREMEERREGKPGEAIAALRRSVKANGESYTPPKPEIEPQVEPQIEPTGWNEGLNLIENDSLDQSVEGMKIVCHELTIARIDCDSSKIKDFVKDADKLVSCLSTKVAKAFDFSLMGASSRPLKFVLNTIMQIFENKKLAHAVNMRTLENLITELLLWLLDERVPNIDDGSQLLKALNVVMLKILDNAERTSMFVILISLLKPLEPSRLPSPPLNESFATRNLKFSLLIVKCLIKFAKVLENTINEINIDHILHSIHEYLQELGMEEIRKRAKIDDKPLRMVKTVLHELVKLRGTAINDHLSLVPLDIKPQPIILAYIDLNLQMLAAKKVGQQE